MESHFDLEDAMEWKERRLPPNSTCVCHMSLGWCGCEVWVDRPASTVH